MNKFKRLTLLSLVLLFFIRHLNTRADALSNVAVTSTSSLVPEIIEYDIHVKSRDHLPPEKLVEDDVHG